MIYFRYVAILLRSALQYRLSMWMTMIGQLFVTLFTFLSMVLLFDRFGSVKGWSQGEVALVFAVTQTGFSLAECIARGFDMFSRSIVRGEFDRVLLRPRGTLLQVFGSDFEITRLAKVLQSLVVMVLAIGWLDVVWTAGKALALVLMIVCSTVIFVGLFILGATVCFFTVQGLETINIFTDGGREIASYPLTIYFKPLVRFFTYIIPFGCANYLPLMAVTGKAGEQGVMYLLSPLLGMLFIIPCLLVWRFGVSRYASTGS